MSRYSLRKLTESEDAFELMRQHRPTDELAEWAKSNMPAGSMSAGELSHSMTVKINGQDVKNLDGNTRNNIYQWLGNGWWGQANWDAYNASGDGRDFFDLEKYPKQIGPNTFSILAPKNAAEWGIPTNPDGTYEIEISLYKRTPDDDLADSVYDFLLGVSERRGMTVEELNQQFKSRFGEKLNSKGVQQGVQGWNSEWKGWPINLQESKRGNKMKITKRQLKRIIREEYSRLKRKGLIREFGADQLADEEEDVGSWIYSQAQRPEGVSLDEIVARWGASALALIDEMGVFDGTGELWLDDQEAIVYARSSQPSAGLGPAVKRYTK